MTSMLSDEILRIKRIRKERKSFFNLDLFFSDPSFLRMFKKAAVGSRLNYWYKKVRRTNLSPSSFYSLVQTGLVLKKSFKVATQKRKGKNSRVDNVQSRAISTNIFWKNGRNLVLCVYTGAHYCSKRPLSNKIKGASCGWFKKMRANCIWRVSPFQSQASLAGLLW